MKLNWSVFISGVFGTVVGGVILTLFIQFGALFVLPDKVQLLTQKSRELSIQTNKIKQDLAYLQGFIKGIYKMDPVAFAKTSKQKNLTSSQTAKALQLLSKEPKKAQYYLENELGFTPGELKRLFPAPIEVPTSSSNKKDLQFMKK